MNAQTQVNTTNATAVPPPPLIAGPRELSDLRLDLSANGYYPVPVIGAHIKTNSAGKRPKMSDWQNKCQDAPAYVIKGWSAPTSDEADCTNTGLLCGEIVGVDIDVLDADLSAKLAARAQELLGPSSLRRIGRAPKVLFVYRVETPHEKLSTPDLIFGDDPTDKNAKAKVETRRAIMCTIDSGEERPELRVFKRNPLAMVRVDRNKYVIAALTVLRAYIVAGKPTQMTPTGTPVTLLGSFEEWSDLIRSALIWLGEADPCNTMEKIRKKDPKLGAMVTVVSQWLEVIGYGASVTAKQLIDHATKTRDGYSLKGDFEHPEFRDALLVVAGDGGAINSLRLGKWLGANQDRYVLGYKIIEAGERGGSKLWKLEPKEPAAVAG